MAWVRSYRVSLSRDEMTTFSLVGVSTSRSSMLEGCWRRQVTHGNHEVTLLLFQVTPDQYHSLGVFGSCVTARDIDSSISWWLPLVVALSQAGSIFFYKQNSSRIYLRNSVIDVMRDFFLVFKAVDSLVNSLLVGPPLPIAVYSAKFRALTPTVEQIVK